MIRKQEFKRSELVVAGTDQKYECVLCGSPGAEKNKITHQPSCVFAQNCVTGIRIDGISGGVVFRLNENGHWWCWKSPGSGEEYRIEKRPWRYVMFNGAGIEIESAAKLYTLRLWVGLNQGVL